MQFSTWFVAAVAGGVPASVRNFRPLGSCRTAGRFSAYRAHLGRGRRPGLTARLGEKRSRPAGWGHQSDTGASGFHVRSSVWVVEPALAWINKHRRCLRVQTRPDHYEAVMHLTPTRPSFRILSDT